MGFNSGVKGLNINENQPSANEGCFVLFTSSRHTPQTKLPFLAVNKRMVRSIKAVQQIKLLSQHQLIPDVFMQPPSAEHGLETLKRNGDKVCYCEMLLN